METELDHYLKHFAEQSGDYFRFRPDYPDSLYQYIVSLTKEQELAWDVGTGNGQAAFKLAQYFKKVIGSDLNQEQLDVALKKDNILYKVWSAEKTEIQNGTVDLVTVAQALHWFPLDAFYQEVKRVSKKNGIIAIWAYSLAKITPALDKITSKLYSEILGDRYWPKERKYIDEGYRNIPFPFKEIDHNSSPKFIIEKNYDFNQFLGYLHTWSAVKEFQKRNQQNPIDLILKDLTEAWGDPNKQILIQWPLHLRVGEVFF